MEEVDARWNLMMGRGGTEVGRGGHEVVEEVEEAWWGWRCQGKIERETPGSNASSTPHSVSPATAGCARPHEKRRCKVPAIPSALHDAAASC